MSIQQSINQLIHTGASALAVKKHIQTVGAPERERQAEIANIKSDIAGETKNLAKIPHSDEFMLGIDKDNKPFDVRKISDDDIDTMSSSLQNIGDYYGALEQMDPQNRDSYRHMASVYSKLQEQLSTRISQRQQTLEARQAILEGTPYETPSVIRSKTPGAMKPGSFNKLNLAPANIGKTKEVIKNDTK